MLNYSKFGKRVRIAMVKKNITLSQLAQAVGISCAYLYDILHGTRQGKPQRQKILAVVGLEPREGE